MVDEFASPSTFNLYDGVKGCHKEFNSISNQNTRLFQKNIIIRKNIIKSKQIEKPIVDTNTSFCS